MEKNKRNSLLLLSFAVILILALAAGLPGLKLANGQPFSLVQGQAQTITPNLPLPGGSILLWIFRAILALALVLLPVYIIYSLFTPAGRKRLLANILLVGVILWVTDYLHKKVPAANLKDAAPQPPVPPNADLGVNLSSPVQFSATPPSWLSLLVILAVSILIVAVILVAIRFIQNRRQAGVNSYADLAREAEMTIASLRRGSDLDTSIIHCYQEMSRIVWKEKGIVRETAMTPREFEDRLEGIGLPRQSIRTLTRLFEQVRYSAVPTGLPEENLALTCLSDIASACKTIGAFHEAG
jgi:hypothetical protein